MEETTGAPGPPKIDVLVRGVGAPNYDVGGEQLTAYINPLAFLEVDEPWASVPPIVPLTDEKLRENLCQPGVPNTLDKVTARYKEISIEEQSRLFVAPIGMLEKLIWPLRHAKFSYALGNPVGTIALCGNVCEMASILRFSAHAEYHGFSNKRKAPAGKYQDLYDDDKFEREIHSKRINALHGLKLIDKTTLDDFYFVNKVRRRYLHLFSQGLADAESDAIQTYLTTVRIAVAILGLKVGDGKMLLDPDIFTWAQKHGHVDAEHVGEARSYPVDTAAYGNA